MTRKLGNAKIPITNDNNISVPVTNLPPIPIPKFNGELWEWEAFWGAFNHSVHSQKMDDYLKMNYLLDSLQGKAKAFVKQYQISRETYPMVIAHLKKKYGNKQALVQQLLDRLHRAQATNEGLEEQESLCETLFSLVSQLRQKGELVDGMYFQKQLLRKFNSRIQRHILEKTDQHEADEAFKTEELLQIANEYITKEIRLRNQVENLTESRMDGKRVPSTLSSNTHVSQRNIQTRGPHPCFYCDRIGHLPNDCVLRCKRTRKDSKSSELATYATTADRQPTDCPTAKEDPVVIVISTDTTPPFVGTNIYRLNTRLQK